jgi:hypothetical protein
LAERVQTPQARNTALQQQIEQMKAQMQAQFQVQMEQMQAQFALQMQQHGQAASRFEGECDCGVPESEKSQV